MVVRFAEAGCLGRVEGGRIAPTKRFFALPVLGPVRASALEPASQEQVEVLTIDDYLIDERTRAGLHKVRGDSMNPAARCGGAERLVRRPELRAR
jgi:repressor LexA